MSTSADFDVKERIRTATDIVDVIGRDLELRPQGRNFVARCPFHNDTRPSMTVNQERQSWKCWVCDIGGDVFSFVMQREGIDFPTALRMLAEAAGIELPQQRQGRQSKPGDPDDKATLLAAIDLVARGYFDQLAEGKSDDAKMARDYLGSRGIDDAHRERFRIGFAPESWDFALNLLRRNDYSEAVARATGVVIARDANQAGSYDRFRGRLMFPIQNAQGRTISLGGRVIPALVAAGGDDKGGAKYINGPETLLYRKSNELYGLDLARDAIRAAGEVLVMEGYTDVVAASIAGVQPVVAVLGTALTRQHVRVLKRYAPRVVLVLDGDDAGRRRADEVLELFVTADADLRVLTLPDGNDPADYLTAHGAAAFAELVAAAPDAMEHKLRRLTDGVDVTRDTHQVTAAVETMLGILIKVPPSSDRGALMVDQLLVRMAGVFGLTVDRLSRRLQSMRQEAIDRDAKKKRYQAASTVPSPNHRNHHPADDAIRGATNAAFDAASDDELAAYGIDPATSSPVIRSAAAALSGIDRQLFETLLESPDVAAMAIESIDPQWLQSTTAQMLLSAYQDLDLQARNLDADSLLILLENESLKNEVISLLERIEQRQAQTDISIDAPADRYAAILTRYHEREFAAEKSRQIQKLKTAVLPEDEELAVLEQLFAAERIRQTPR